MKKTIIFAAMIFISRCVMAQEPEGAICVDLLKKGKESYNSGKFEEAKKRFESGIKRNCNKDEFQEWANKCDEQIKALSTPKPVPKTPTSTPVTTVPITSETPPPSKDIALPELDVSECFSLMHKAVNANPTYSYNNGDKYKGQANGARNGKGVYCWNEAGSFYFGDYKNKDRDGYGIYLCAAGSVPYCPDCKYYAGEWSSGKKSGKGNCYDKTGKLIYIGGFSNNQPDETYPTTSKEYEAYRFETINYSDSIKYIGETKDGNIHGHGIFLWKDGDMWYGTLDSEKRIGVGILIKFDGSLFGGVWTEGRFLPDIHGDGTPERYDLD
jgi:hypothetical protein